MELPLTPVAVSPNGHEDHATTVASPTRFGHLSDAANDKVKQGIPWYKGFCLAKGHDYEGALMCTRGSGQDAQVDIKYFDEFVAWLGEQGEKDVDVVIPPECSRPHRRPVTKHTLRTVERWMFNQLNHQLRQQGARVLGDRESLASKLPSWAEAKAKLVSRDTARKLATSVPLDRTPPPTLCPLNLPCSRDVLRHTETNTRGDFALSLDFQQLRNIGLHARENDLTELQSGFAISAMDAMGNRGMNLRDGTLVYCFVHSYPNLNHGHGMDGLVLKNFNGHKGHDGDTLYSACIPHRNPAMCTIGLFGTVLMFRFDALPIPEPFPRIDDKSSFHQLPLIRNRKPVSVPPHVAGVTDSTLREWVAQSFGDVGIEREGYDPLLHGLRHHCEQQLKQALHLSKDDRENFMARAEGVQDRTYTANIVPPLCQSARAGYSVTDEEDEAAHMAIWR